MDSENKGENRVRFDANACKCDEFVDSLMSCRTADEIKTYVDGIIDEFPNDGVTKIGIDVKPAYRNGGRYSGFINPSISIKNAPNHYGYRIYDREYLYSFAIGLHQLNINNSAQVMRFVLSFLNTYFGFKNDTVDRRDDVMYEFALQHAEEFVKENNIEIPNDMSAVDALTLEDAIPLSSLRGKCVAECMERSALAQNLLKMCGYNSSIEYGTCISRGKSEGHSWNTIKDQYGNILVIDYSNTVHVFKEGKFAGRVPYYGVESKDEFERLEGLIEAEDYTYQDGVKVIESQRRTYVAGKDLTKEQKKIENDDIEL